MGSFLYGVILASSLGSVPIRVNVTYSDGFTPVPDAQVEVAIPNGQPIHSTTDPRGQTTFSIPEMPFGTKYTLSASKGAIMSNSRDIEYTIPESYHLVISAAPKTVVWRPSDDQCFPVCCNDCWCCCNSYCQPPVYYSPAPCECFSSLIPAPVETRLGRIAVAVPEDAVVFINGLRTKSTGTNRVYTSRGLKAGFEYDYTIRVQYRQNGKPIEVAKHLKLHAEETRQVAFDGQGDARGVSTLASLHR